MDFWVSGELSREQILGRANTFRKKKGRYLIKMVKIVRRAWVRPKKEIKKSKSGAAGCSPIHIHATANDSPTF